jgi:Response regulators consisting of a CheY-like receiver domain and a winged-helix DNA-binding domain
MNPNSLPWWAITCVQVGYSVDHLAEGLAVIPAIRQGQYDLILLDLMLPGRDGLDICRELRGFSQMPLIMMTARVDEIDRLLGLELGADDYICKPFSPRELVARVKAVLRRSGQQAPSLGLELDARAFQARYQGVPLDLTPVEFRMLAALAARPGQVLSRDQLMNHIYQDHRVVADRTVDSHVKKFAAQVDGGYAGA